MGTPSVPWRLRTVTGAGITRRCRTAPCGPGVAAPPEGRYGPGAAHAEGAGPPRNSSARSRARSFLAPRRPRIVVFPEGARSGLAAGWIGVGFARARHPACDVLARCACCGRPLGLAGCWSQPGWCRAPGSPTAGGRGSETCERQRASRSGVGAGRATAGRSGPPSAPTAGGRGEAACLGRLAKVRPAGPQARPRARSECRERGQPRDRIPRRRLRRANNLPPGA